MDNIEVIIGDFNKKEDREDMLKMLDLYMQDPMGGAGTLSEELAQKNIKGLKEQPNYVFFLAKCNGEIAGLANCFVNFSTFKGKQLINIHDFAVDPHFRRKGIGKTMMNKIVEYAKENGYCKVTLEVRHDNPKAQLLYKKAGFEECNPSMYFWQLMI